MAYPELLYSHFAAGRELPAALLLQQFQNTGVLNLRNLVFRRVGILLHQKVFVVGQAGGMVEQIADA